MNLQHEFHPVPKPMKKRPTKIISCDECGVQFERRTDQINRRSKQNYCSPKCANTVNARNRKNKPLPKLRTGREIKCKMCGKPFYVSGSRLKNGAKFCSKACNGKWESEHPTPNFIGSANNAGEKNGRYKHGNRIGGHISKKNVREQVINRDGDWCLICGKPPKGLHLHRVIYGSQGGKYVPENCVQLCPEHHALIHSSKKKWQPALLKYLDLCGGYADFKAREWMREYAVHLAKELAGK